MWRDSESDKDFLNFTEVADQIVTLVTSPDLLPVSVGVFGGWGSGKSTVLKLVEGRLPPPDQGGPQIIKFDAWLYQGFDDARAALMEIVSGRLQDLAKGNETLLTKAKDFAARVNYFRALGSITGFGVGMAFGIPPGLLTKAGGALGSLLSGQGGSDDVDDVLETGKKAKSTLASWLKPAKDTTPPKEIHAFREQFSELLEGLDTSVVVFIDNLDRCLPDVAIATLEAVRLFLFMPRTAFLIAADEDMIRHSVAKHFQDPEASHVRDYLDKVIQVPLRVPQVGVEDLRAYMYSLFVGVAAPQALGEVQQFLLDALQNSWKGKSFTKEEISNLCGDPTELLDRLAIADRLAPMLASAPNIQGNPRIVKRLLNSITLRQLLAQRRAMNVDLSTLAKLAVFERCTDEQATLTLYRLIIDEGDVEKQLLPPDRIKGRAVDLPTTWKTHEDFIAKWRAMDPIFEHVDLKPAVFLSRDVMAPARSRSDMSAVAEKALAGLMKVTSINSPVGKQIVQELALADKIMVMSRLIDSMRQSDWTSPVEGIHGALILASQSPEGRASLESFVTALPRDGIHKAMKYLLKQHQLLKA